MYLCAWVALLIIKEYVTSKSGSYSPLKMSLRSQLPKYPNIFYRKWLIQNKIQVMPTRHQNHSNFSGSRVLYNSTVQCGVQGWFTAGHLIHCTGLWTDVSVHSTLAICALTDWLTSLSGVDRQSLLGDLPPGSLGPDLNSSIFTCFEILWNRIMVGQKSGIQSISRLTW